MAGTYSIAELQKETGASRRTIHYYVQQGVLPPPVGAGPRAAYSDVHRLRLLAVKHLQAAGWRLDRIRTFFDQSPLATIRHVVETGRVPAEEDTVNEPTAGVKDPETEELRRYHLAPGIELLVSSTADAEDRLTIERSIPLIAGLFRSRQNGHQSAPISRSDPR
ncbi:MAG: MerR family transcriptional regulator [Chloroflexi bacterium]|nr:MerR family transcriptional regulator [Chloroflexota bacterium]